MVLNKIRKRISYLIISLKDKLYGSNKDFDPNQVKNLILIVGPYRNLTTYLTSILSLHKNCIILNHAGIRVFQIKRINFLKDYTNAKYQGFLRFFDYACRKGYRGMLGGSIEHSHAFESNPELSTLFNKSSSLRGKSSCFVWKESHMVTRRLMDNPENLEKIVENNASIKFLMPVRKPLDCARSNIKTGKSRFFKTSQTNDLMEVTKSIFEQHLFFLSLQNKYPDRVFFLFEHEINASSLKEMCAFMEIDNDEKWISTVLSQHKIKAGYTHPEDIVKNAKALIDTMFADNDSFRKKLHSLI